MDLLSKEQMEPLVWTKDKLMLFDLGIAVEQWRKAVEALCETPYYQITKTELLLGGSWRKGYLRLPLEGLHVIDLRKATKQLIIEAANLW